ncbi:MAG: hypothetical protein ACRCZ2_07260 [Fusobacteriaceae bacterium]
MILKVGNKSYKTSIECSNPRLKVGNEYLALTPFIEEAGEGEKLTVVFDNTEDKNTMIIRPKMFEYQEKLSQLKEGFGISKYDDPILIGGFEIKEFMFLYDGVGKSMKHKKFIFEINLPEDRKLYKITLKKNEKKISFYKCENSEVFLENINELDWLWNEFAAGFVELEMDVSEVDANNKAINFIVLEGIGETINIVNDYSEFGLKKFELRKYRVPSRNVSAIAFETAYTNSDFFSFYSCLGPGYENIITINYVKAEGKFETSRYDDNIYASLGTLFECNKKLILKIKHTTTSPGRKQENRYDLKLKDFSLSNDFLNKNNVVFKAILWCDQLSLSINVFITSEFYDLVMFLENNFPKKDSLYQGFDVSQIKSLNFPAICFQYDPKKYINDQNFDPEYLTVSDEEGYYSMDDTYGDAYTAFPYFIVNFLDDDLKLKPGVEELVLFSIVF